MGLSFKISAGPRHTVFLRSESRRIHDHILLAQIRDSPNLEGQVAVFITLRNKVARLYTQVLGTFLVASYDSQGYGGGIRTRLHTGYQLLASHSCIYCTALARTAYKTSLPLLRVP
jgi:hypothetical protein